ncbi:GNAT family N-acetyltransferase [Streptomyces sp. NPDC048172]|uniref:GNAT family N-acetyltransferase n=1 Tax=Streptomyces sp. NPDC048172 TaxID=3365505 RepID=UPI00371B1B8B
MNHVPRTAVPGDEPALHALWSECFGPTAAHLPALYSLDPGRHRRTFVAARPDDGTPDAVVVVVPRLVRGADGVPRRVGGLGSVAARPAARGRGLIRALLGEAVRAMEAEGFAWSLLFTDTPRVYEGAGWRTFARMYAEGEPTRSAAPRSRYRVREAAPSELPRLHAAARPLTAVRTPEDWRVRVPSWYGPSALWLVAEHGTTTSRTPVGYAVSHRTSGQALSLAEFGSLPGTEDCLPALFAAHAAHACGEEAERIRVPLTPDAQPALPHLLQNPTWHTDRTGMVRDLHSPATAPEARGAAYWFGDAF